MADDSRLVRSVPPLGALVYPTVIAWGTALSPAFLLVALLVPVGAVIALQGTSPRYPRSRAVALVTVGVPPLYSWLGQLLDGQHVFPFQADGFWMALFAVLLALAATERPTEPAAPVPGSSRLAFAHGVSAAIVTTFAAVHVINHLSGLWGGDTHIAVMNVLRLGYRQPLVETVLLSAVAFQVFSGLRLLSTKSVRGLAWPDTLQRASGAYLAMFFVSHLTAALRNRHLRGVDTNWVWLTQPSMLTDAWSARLPPYYFLGIVALAIHGGLGVRAVMLGHGAPVGLANRVATATSLIGVAASTLALTGLLRA